MNRDLQPPMCDDLAESRDPVEKLGEELLQRRRAGEKVTTQEYALAHPELADQIRLQFPVMIALEKFKESALSSPSEPYDIDVQTPQELGDFHIIREIGRGAMGVVYEAEQQSLQRRVAVKVFPKQTLRETRKLERFARESKMAARLHHNNIVPVFGVGHHEGLHYFVMQRIEGTGLDEIIDRAKSRLRRDASRDDTLDVRRGSESTADSQNIRSSNFSRLLSGSLVEHSAPEPEQAPLMEVNSGVVTIVTSFRRAAQIGIQVADAIHYAHSQGVLHRDIKPSNLMIDGNGTVWVTDFGLATALQDDQSVGQNGDVGTGIAGKPNSGTDIAGTLRFMAPEQLGGKHDTRSDIYSLGVTLYELITLQPAFVAGSKADVVDRILKGEFARPCDVRARVPKDLEAIVLKAMALSPKDRYQNGKAFAEDLTRFVDQRPVAARPIGGIGRFSRWARREPLAASLAGLLACVICTSFVLVSSKWRESVAERQRAENNLEVALESMDQILSRFTSSWMASPTEPAFDLDDDSSGVELQMLVSDHSASLMEDAIRFYDRFADGNAPSPRLQRDTARVHRRAGDIYQRLGQYEKAEHAYARCLEILFKQNTDNDTSLLLAKASALNQLGLAKHASSQFPEAEAVFLRAQSVLNSRPSSDDPECNAELARTFSNLGQSQWMMMHHDDAKRSHRKAVSIMENLVERLPDDPNYQLALARAYRAYYPFAWDWKNDESGRVKEAGIAILDDLVSRYPNVPDYQCELVELLTSTNHRFRRSRNVEKQVDELSRGIEIARDLNQAYPAIPRYRVALALALKTMAETLNHSEPDEASEKMKEAIGIYRSLTRSLPDVPVYHMLCAMALREHSDNLYRMERYSESKASALEGIRQVETYNKLRPGNQFGMSVLARLYDEVADSASSLDQNELAETSRSKAAEIRVRWERRRRR